MRELLREGRRIWNLFELDGLRIKAGPYLVTGFKQFLPAGPTGEDTERRRSLVQLYTDPGGLRTLAVAEIWSRDPDQSTRPW